jgi:hypothetical protein
MANVNGLPATSLADINLELGRATAIVEAFENAKQLYDAAKYPEVRLLSSLIVTKGVLFQKMHVQEMRD